MKRAVLALATVTAVVLMSVASYAQAPKEIKLVNEKSKGMGVVTFTHEVHSKANKCDTCHATAAPTAASHALKTADQKPNPFHAPGAKAGLCVDCHAEQAKAGNAKVPTKCADCHKKGA